MQLKDYVKFSPDGKSYLRIKVVPRQTETKFVGIMDDGETYKFKLKAVPEKWKANSELISYLSSELGLKKEDIDIIWWASDQLKLIRLNKK